MLESSFNGHGIGFQAAVVPGTNLVTGDPSVAKSFVFKENPMSTTCTIVLFWARDYV